MSLYFLFSDQRQCGQLNSAEELEGVTSSLGGVSLAAAGQERGDSSHSTEMVVHAVNKDTDTKNTVS